MDRFNAMEILVAVIEAGSFSAAARRLDLGQPAVSKSIAQLEASLGTRLFVRTTRGLAPTEAARAYYSHARQALAAGEAAEQAARVAGSGLAGRLRISCPVTFARLHVIPLLAPLLAEYPALSIDVVLDDRHVDLLQEGVDLALRIGPLPDSSMIARRLASSPRRVIGAPAYFAAHGMPKAPADLQRHQCVIYAQGDSAERVVFLQGEQRVDVPLQGRLRINAAEGVRAAVIAGLGLAVVSEWMFAPELARGIVLPVLADWQLPWLDLWAVYPAGRLPSQKARVFADFIEQALRQTQAPARLASG